MKKGKLIQLRISEREKNIIQEKANAMQMSISDYIRHCAINKKIKGDKKMNFDNMKECIRDVDYWYTEDNGDLFFADEKESYKLKEDIRETLIYFDEQKGYFLEDGRSIKEVIEQ
jgi:hypothetical protein